MRTIKFRIWNDKTKTWIHGPHEKSYLDGVNLFGEHILFGNLLDGVSIEDLNEIKALQYTGLKDSQGKEIFEGDILKVKGYGSWFDKIGYYYNFEVKFEIKPSGESEIAGFIHIPKDRWVIGNVFENPELVAKAT